MERDPRSAPGTSAPENDDRGGLTRGLAIRDAHIFRDTVEGGPGCDSARVVNSNLVIDIGKDIPDGAPPRPELIAALLRSATPLTPELRHVIADMIDPGAESVFCFKKFGRRKGGNPAKLDWGFERALVIAMKIDEDGYESGLAFGEKKFGISRSTAGKLVQKLQGFLLWFDEQEELRQNLAVRLTPSG